MPDRLASRVATTTAAFTAICLAAASLAAAGAVGSLFLGTAADSWAALSAPGPADPADGILLVVVLGGALLTIWLGLSTALSALSTLPGAMGLASSHLAGRIAPAAVRKVVAFVLGATLGAILIPGPAVARPGHESRQPALAAASTADPAPPPSWLSEVGGPSPEVVVVHRGDTLWSLAARHLGPDATTAQIAAEWPRWFAANRDVIGADPDLIAPGQQLHPPTTRADS